MSLTLRHPTAALVLFMIFMGLFVTIYTGFEETYGITGKNLDDEGKTIAQSLKSLTITVELESISTAIEQLKSPQNPLDMLGGLAAAAQGILSIIGKIVTFPVRILAIIFGADGFYPGIIPSFVNQALGALVILYIAFVIISIKLKSDA